MRMSRSKSTVLAIKWLVGLLLLGPVSAGAAVVCGNVTLANTNTPADPETISYTTPGGANFLGVLVGTRRVISPNINVPTHAGNAMTSLDAEEFNSPAG